MLSYDLDINTLLDLDVAEVPEFCNSALDLEVFAEELDFYMSPFNRRQFCEFSGIANSTLSGWFKEQRMPMVAKEVYVLLRAFLVLRKEIHRLKEEFQDPKIVETDAGFQICVFKPNEDGIMIGSVLASGIKSLSAARRIAGSTQSLRLLNEALDFVAEEIESRGDDVSTDYLEDLKKRVHSQVLFSANYEQWQKLYGENRWSYMDLSFLDGLITDGNEKKEELINAKGSQTGKYTIQIEESVISENTLGGLLVSCLKEMHKKDPEFLPKLSRKGGRIRRIVAQDPSLLFHNRPDLSKSSSKEIVDGWWVGTNISNDNTKSILRQVCDVAGLSYGDDMKILF